MRTLALAALLLGAGTAGCVSSPRNLTANSIPARSTNTTTTTTTTATQRTDGRSVDLRLKLDDRGLHVVVHATAPTSDELREWRIAEDPPKHLEVRDADAKPIAFTSADKKISLAAGQAAGSRSITLSYDIVERDGADARAFREDPRASIVAASQFRAAGEAIVALPTAFARRSFALTVDIDARSIDAPVVGSSFGVARGGHVHRELPSINSAEVRRSAFLAGPGGHAIFDAPEGHDEVAWIGYTAFDPRPVAAEVAVFRGTLRDHFKSELGPQTMLLTVDRRPAGHFRVQRRLGGLLVALAGADPFDATLRLAVAHELVHAWIGDRLWIGDTRQGHEAGTFWFHEGYARWVAREQLYRVGLLSPDEYAAEVNRLLSIVTTSPHAHRPMSELVADVKAGGVVPLLVARGALHATLVDERIRSGVGASKTKSLDDVLRSLLHEVEERPGAISEDRWHQAIAEVGGGGAKREQEDHEDMVVTGKRTTLPADALGACFELHEMAYDIYDAGFDVVASRDGGKVMGLRSNGPAAKAGLRDGDAVVKIEEAGAMMKIEIDRSEKAEAAGGKMITYRASSGTRRGPGFKKRAGLSDDACRKLALRK